MKDEAKDEVVIVFLGPRVAAFPQKRARAGRTRTGKRTAKNPARYPAGLATQFFRMPFYMRVAIRGQENFQQIFAPAKSRQ